MTLRKLAVASILCSFLSACGGGPAGVAPSADRTSSKDGSATVRIVIPTAASKQARRPSYISSGTQSISITVNGGTPTVLALNAQSSLCATTAQGLACTLTVSAPFGSDTFAVSLFASPNGSGTPLATQTVTATVSQTSPTSISLSLDGVVASIGLSLSNASPTEGSAATLTLTATAHDASGATIIGSDPFVTPITISDSDTSGATALSSTQVTSPSSNTVTVHYTGAAATTALFTATSGNVTAHVTLSSVAPPQTLWVANNGGFNVLAFSPSSAQSANAAPIATIAGTNTQFSTYSPQCVQFDASGHLIVVGSHGANSPGAIELFTSPASGGNLTPAAIVSGTSTTFSTPVGCALDNSGDLWIANDDNFSYSVVMFTPQQIATGGNVAPARVIAPVTCCGNSSLCNTVSMAFDPSGNLWTGSLCAPTAEFSAASIASSGSPTPVGYFGQTGGANGIAFDSSGNLWTAIGASVTEFNAAGLAGASSGSLTANIAISGALTQIANSNGLAFDSAGNLWVSDATNNTVLEFAKASLATGGNIAPVGTISGATSLLAQPNGLRFH